MGRNILGAIVGYVGMVAFIFPTLTAAFTLMGTDGALQPGSFRPSAMWLIVWFAVSVGAALLGGCIAAWIGKSRGAVKILIGIVVVFGAVTFAATVFKADPGPRAGELTAMEAMNQSVQPLWAAGLTPLVGALGSWLGGGLVLQRRERRSTAA